MNNTAKKRLEYYLKTGKIMDKNYGQNSNKNNGALLQRSQISTNKMEGLICKLKNFYFAI